MLLLALLLFLLLGKSSWRAAAPSHRQTCRNRWWLSECVVPRYSMLSEATNLYRLTHSDEQILLLPSLLQSLAATAAEASVWLHLPLRPPTDWLVSSSRPPHRPPNQQLTSKLVPPVLMLLLLLLPTPHCHHCQHYPEGVWFSAGRTLYSSLLCSLAAF